VGEEEKKEEAKQKIGEISSAGSEPEAEKKEEQPKEEPDKEAVRPEPLEEEPEVELKDQVISIRRVTKVVKGGKNLSFSALVAVGNERGLIGIGKGKAREVPVAIAKAAQDAKKNLIEVPIKGTTVPHFIKGVHGGGEVVLRPASKGTGVIAGGAVRVIMQLAGIKDILTKSLRSNNPISVAHATMNALKRLKDPEHVSKIRGKAKESIWQ
jgi:small subunit ribosomal protein S5